MGLGVVIAGRTDGGGSSLLVPVSWWQFDDGMYGICGGPETMCKKSGWYGNQVRKFYDVVVIVVVVAR